MRAASLAAFRLQSVPLEYPSAPSPLPRPPRVPLGAPSRRAPIAPRARQASPRSAPSSQAGADERLPAPPDPAASPALPMLSPSQFLNLRCSSVSPGGPTPPLSVT